MEWRISDLWMIYAKYEREKGNPTSIDCIHHQNTLIIVDNSDLYFLCDHFIILVS